MKNFTVFTIFCAIFVAVARSQTGKIPEVAANLGLTTLVEKVTEVKLVNRLSGQGPYTVFAPVNEAFGKLRPPIDRLVATRKPFLRYVLRYHVFDGDFKSSDLHDEYVLTSVIGRKARINLYPKGQDSFEVATLQCAPIDLSRVDQEASNGVIHVLNSVMIPPTTNILEFLDFVFYRTLASYVKDYGVAYVLAGKRPMTLFAPDDQAFAKLAADDVHGLMASPDAIRRMLFGHVINGTYCSAGLTSGPIGTLSGRELQISKTSDGIKVNNANVLQADGSVTNGVVHTIDTVLV